MKTLTIVDEIYNYIDKEINPHGWAYMSREAGIKKYIPFIAFLAWLSPESFPFKYTSESPQELIDVVDRPDESIYHDYLFGGIHSAKPMFSIFKRDDGLYPETVESLYVDFRSHFSMHSIPLSSIPEAAFKKLQAYLEGKQTPVEGSSFIIAGDFSQARYVKKKAKKR